MGKILALQLKRIGDVILTLPAIDFLCRENPGAEVVVVLVDGCGALVPLLPAGVRASVYRRGRLNAGVWREIAFSRFSACYDFTGNDRAALMARLSRAETRVGYRKAVEKRGSRRKIFDRVCEASVRNLHTIEYHNALVDAGSQRPGFRPEIPAGTVAEIDRVLEQAGVGERFAVVHPGTARDEKYWPAERWAEVIDHLAGERGMQVVLTGSREPREQAHLASLRSAIGGRPPIDLSGKVDLVGLAELLRRARLVLGVDSAAMHLAALFGVPEIALFGPTNPFHWRPLHPRAQILLAGHDAPVEDFQPRHEAAPMDTISTATVIRAIGTELD